MIFLKIMKCENKKTKKQKNKKTKKKKKKKTKNKKQKTKKKIRVLSRPFREEVGKELICLACGRSGDLRCVMLFLVRKNLS